MNLLECPTALQWKRIGLKPRHGIALPLFSLRSNKGYGIGEFLDLLPIIDWCKEAGFDIIQLLPLSDSGSDPAPYNALSSCALNPVYLSLHALPGAKNLPDAAHLSALPRLAYHDVQSLKVNYLRNYYENGGKTLLKEPGFEEYVGKHPWVVPYALFKTLKDRLGQNPWMSWPDELKKPQYETLLEKHHEEMLFYAALQYLCYKQLTEVKNYAHERGVLLEGDIPILISPDSVDMWLKPELFDFTRSAGAPPDPYNAEGQYWGFPLFDWENMRKENYAWWKMRLAAAADYYHLYRIDHVVGFFRLWAILHGRPAKEGHFIPENPALWIPQGREILQMMIDSCPMLPIAEDLGQVPPSVRACLLEMGICGTKVVRWERDYDDGKEFIPLQKYPEVSLTTVSTHDSETLQLWWQACPEEAKAFCAFKGWTYSPDLTKGQRLDMLSDAHSTPSLFHVNLLQEYLALFPDLVWPNPLDERINVPGTVAPTNWTYRFKPSVEEIVRHEGLKEAIQTILGKP